MCCGSLTSLHRFNRRCEANPLATYRVIKRIANLHVSIADAKPILWRQCHSCDTSSRQLCVSIADAKPILWRLLLSPMISRPRCVSIADAKPILWRPDSTFVRACVIAWFQSQMRSQSSGDASRDRVTVKLLRCFNRRCEANPLATKRRRTDYSDTDGLVSIADAKPILWRHTASTHHQLLDQ